MTRNTYELLAFIFLMNGYPIVYTGDPCPNKNELASCTCKYTENNHDVSAARSQIHFTPGNVSRVPRSLGKSDIRPDVSLAALSSLDSNRFSHTVVRCTAPESLFVLEEVISNAFYKKTIDHLIISDVPPAKGYKLVYLPKGWLKTVRIGQFEIRDTPLPGDFIYNTNPFESQENSLITFTTVNCNLYGMLTFETQGSINTKGLNLLSRLEAIDFSNNYLSIISSTSFRYPPRNLSSIILRNNSIRTIESSAFAYATMLKKIDLSHNIIDNVVRNIFQAPAKLLEDINISWNSIRFLPVDFFTNMPALKNVNLERNFMYALPEKTWSIWPQLQFIDLRGNFLECNCDLLWLLNFTTPITLNSTVLKPATSTKQTFLGTCSYTDQQLQAQTYQLSQISRPNLNCS